MRETGVIFAVGVALAVSIAAVQFIGMLDESNVDMLTTGITLAIVLVPVAILGIASAVVVVVLARKQGAYGHAAQPALELPAIRVERPTDLQHRKQEADTAWAEARAAKAVMLLEDKQRSQAVRPVMQPGPWVTTETER